MTRSQYRAALRRLKLQPASKKTAKMLGYSVRYIQRFSDGDHEVPWQVAALLFHMLATARFTGRHRRRD